MNLYTIGFSKKTAKEFFETLKINGVKRLIDIRESNTNIYAGFTMRQNLPYFLDKICSIDYQEIKVLAPTKDLRKTYHDTDKSDWAEYEAGYINLLDQRSVKLKIQRELLEESVLLCSEPTAEKCHRRLAAEYFQKIYPDIKIVHL